MVDGVERWLPIGAKINNGYATVCVSHFCKFVPVGQKSDEPIPVRVVPFFNQLWRRVSLLIFHHVECICCQIQSQTYEEQLLLEDGCVKARGFEVFYLYEDEGAVCVDVGFDWNNGRV